MEKSQRCYKLSHDIYKVIKLYSLPQSPLSPAHCSPWLSSFFPASFQHLSQDVPDTSRVTFPDWTQHSLTKPRQVLSFKELGPRSSLGLPLSDLTVWLSWSNQSPSPVDSSSWMALKFSCSSLFLSPIQDYFTASLICGSIFLMGILNSHHSLL